MIGKFEIIINDETLLAALQAYLEEEMRLDIEVLGYEMAEGGMLVRLTAVAKPGEEGALSLADDR